MKICLSLKVNSTFKPSKRKNKKILEKIKSIC